jgi:hypothetical protein
MIITVEVPHNGRPRAWFAFNEDDFIRKVKAQQPPEDAVIFATMTARELLQLSEMVSDSAVKQTHVADVQVLADAHGWDTPLYRADHLLAPGIYQAEEVSEFVAHVAAVAQHLQLCRVYQDEEDAMHALYGDPLYAGEPGFYAHMALREQLIALEVIADDL